MQPTRLRARIAARVFNLERILSVFLGDPELDCVWGAVSGCDQRVVLIERLPWIFSATSALSPSS